MNSLLPTTPEGASSGAELVTSDGRSLALVSAELRGEAQGGIARLVLEQRFVNAYDENLRVTYRMPLPADGAVSGYEFEIGDRVIKGVIDRKRAARERFERAVASGYTAALLEQERADIFTQQIGNLPASSMLLARITIDQHLVWLPEGEWELRFPTVIGPRYIGSADTAADVRATHIKVTERPRSSIQIAIHVRDPITGGAKPNSPSHSLVQRADGITELHSGSRLDRDIVMRWPVATPAPGLSLATAMTKQGAYGLLTIVPPARDAKVAPVPRDLLVLLDTSGSMSGGPLDKAKQVVCMMLDSLADHDRFELIEFSNEPRRYSPEPITATAKAKQQAIHWVRSRHADGGTEMRAAIVEGLASLRVGAQRQVVVVTDGYVGGEQQIIEAINRRLPKSCRVHVLGVGSAVNRSLATAIARAGKGAEVIVGIDEDAERGAKRLLDRTSMPMLTNVEISGSALLRHAPERIPDVFEGAPLVAALAVKPEGGELVVRGQTARETWTQTIALPAQRLDEGNGAIAALYGRERVADVEANSVFATSDGEIEELGLTFQIATKMTSWVAVDETRKVTGPTRDQLVPQELPYGTRAEAFGLRGGHDHSAHRTQSGAIRSPELEALQQQLLTRGASLAEVDEIVDAFGDQTSLSSAPRSYSAQFEKESDFEDEEATGRARLIDLALDETVVYTAGAPSEPPESPPPAQALGGVPRTRAPSPTTPGNLPVPAPMTPARSAQDRGALAQEGRAAPTTRALPAQEEGAAPTTRALPAQDEGGATPQPGQPAQGESGPRTTPVVVAKIPEPEAGDALRADEKSAGDARILRAEARARRSLASQQIAEPLKAQPDAKQKAPATQTKTTVLWLVAILAIVIGLVLWWLAR